MNKTFVELVVEYPDPELCTYEEYKGKPYYSIKYTENGETYVGYGTYNPEVLSLYLKEYFMPSAQPDKEALDDAYAHGYTYAESKYRAIMSDGDCISRQAALNMEISDAICEGGAMYASWRNVRENLENLPSVQPEIIRCKDCKHFELDHWEYVHGVKLIVAHEICMRWENGVKTDQNGYCFLAERRTDEQTD